MGSATRIVRMALHAFFSNYHPAASAAALLALPFSAAALVSRSPALLAQRPVILPALSRRLRRVLVAAGFPPASQLLFLLNHRLSQSIFSFLATLPFSLSFLLLAKAYVVRATQARGRGRGRSAAPAASGPLRLRGCYPAMATTQLANFAALLFAHAAVFAALLAAFSGAEALRLGSEGRAMLALSAAGVIVYSVALANATAVCNLATVVAAAEGRSGCHAVLKAVLLVRGDAATAVAVALPASLATAAVEGLFQIRITRPYMLNGKMSSAMVCEGFLIAYIHSMICVLDTVITCMVYQTCKASHSCDLLELEEKGDFAA
ncbi:hypothetical protein GUJ93_ZPchr0009g1003 [Zizania palustris]|uniref:Uncharacterized protein n=1 Tax=Zizania palustris TaxID=103762 RepID=A0A8J5S2Y4_ZIZPA|nr:hypothetical protein GUJ93_ZPchr0009g1003 [Zizania palustris]